MIELFENGKYINFIIYLIILIFILIFVIGLIIEIIMLIIRKKRETKVNYNFENIRYYTMDVNKQTVIYFDKKQMKKKIVTTTDAFYLSFPYNNDSAKVRKWVEDFLAGKQRASILTVTVKEEKGKIVMTLLRFTKYNPKLGILHFENVLLPKIKTTSKQKCSNYKYNYVFNMDDVHHLLGLKKYRKKTINCIFVKLNAFNNKNEKNNTVSDTSTTITSIYQPLNSIYRFLSKTRVLTFLSDNEAIIFDSSLQYHYEVENLCKNLLWELDKFFNVKSLNNLYDVSLGVSYYNAKENRELEKSIAIARDLAISANKSDLSMKVLYEGDASFNLEASEEIVRADIRKIIKNSTISYTFSPILHFDKNIKIYNIQYSVYGSMLDKYSELITYAKKYNLLESLYSMNCNNIINYLKGIENSKIFFDVNFEDMNEILKLAKKIDDFNKYFIILFSYKQIYYHNSLDDKTKNIFHKLKENGILIAIALDVESSFWSKEILSLFDFYILPCEKGESLHLSERSSNALIVASSILSDYLDKVIVINLGDLSDVEYAYELGFRGFGTSDKITPYSNAPYIPDNYWLVKITSMNKDEARKTREIPIIDSNTIDESNKKAESNSLTNKIESKVKDFNKNVTEKVEKVVQKIKSDDSKKVETKSNSKPKNNNQNVKPKEKKNNQNYSKNNNSNQNKNKNNYKYNNKKDKQFYNNKSNNSFNKKKNGNKSNNQNNRKDK